MGKPVRRFFCVQRGVVKHDASQGVGKTPYPLPLRPPVARLVPFLPGQLVGGLDVRKVDYLEMKKRRLFLEKATF